MLRLWPEQRSLALFSDRAWIYAGKELLAESTAPHASGILDAADALLRRLPAPAWPRLRLHLLLSDEMARTVVLPWQEGLRTESQQLRYAEACLEDAGVHGPGWTVQHGYCHYGQTGMAFAVHTDTLQQLTSLVEARQMKLASVLPVVAAAYWRHRPGRGKEALLILVEARRITALRFSRHGLAGLDVQPVMESKDTALRRLLRRMQLHAGDVASIAYWSAEDARPFEETIAACYPTAQLKVIVHRSLI